VATHRFRRIPNSGAHRPHGSSWALLRGALHAFAPDPAAPGPIRGLEQEAGFHLHSRHAVAFGSAHHGLEHTLRALALPSGSTVLLPAIAQAWVHDAVRAAGLAPMLVDIHPDTLHMDLDALQAAKAPNAAAVLVEHTAGVPCDLDATRATCDALGLPMIELFGMAVGGRWRAQPVGSHGRAGVADLDCGLLTAFGGCLVTSEDGALTSRLRASLEGQPEPPALAVAGRIGQGQLRALAARPIAFGLLHRGLPLADTPGTGNVRMHPAQAEALRTALALHEAHLDRCRERAAQLRWALGQGVWRQDVPDGALPAWSQLIVRSHDPAGCAQAALDAGIQLGQGPLTVPSDSGCPHAARAAAECIALPCHAGMNDADAERVIAATKSWLI